MLLLTVVQSIKDPKGEKLANAKFVVRCLVSALSLTGAHKEDKAKWDYRINSMSKSMKKSTRYQTNISHYTGYWDEAKVLHFYFDLIRSTHPGIGLGGPRTFFLRRRSLRKTTLAQRL